MYGFADKSQRLLPVLIGSAFFSQEGYMGGYFLAPVDMDTTQVERGRLAWSVRISSRQPKCSTRLIQCRTIRHLFSRYQTCCRGL